jgi:multiple sugar transport system permease protein
VAAATSGGHRHPSQPAVGIRQAPDRAPAPRTLPARQGLSDRALAWLFVGPTIALLLAFNIFPAVLDHLAVVHQFPRQPAQRRSPVGGDRQLPARPRQRGDLGKHAGHGALPGVSIALQLVLGFALALLLNRRFRTHSFWSTAILLPMMLAPAVVGTFWKYFFEPQYGIFNAIARFLGSSGNFTMLGSTQLSPWAIVLVDTWMWTPYVMLLLLAGLKSIPPLCTRLPRSIARRSGPSSGTSPCPWSCPSSCLRCCFAPSRTSRCSTWWTS